MKFVEVAAPLLLGFGISQAALVAFKVGDISTAIIAAAFLVSYGLCEIARNI